MPRTIRVFSPLFISLALTVFLLGACKTEKEDLQGAAFTAIKGTVVVTDQSGNQRRVTSDNLYTKEALLTPGSIAETGANSQADLEFLTGIKMRIGAKSKIKLVASRVLTGKNFNQVQLDLNRGRILSRSGKLGTGSHIIVHTPTSVASVRGTEFLVKEEKGESTTLVKEGTVTVADTGMTKSEAVEPDKKAVVDEKGAIEVKPQDENDKKELNRMGSDMASITENGRAQIQDIMKTFEEQKALIKQSLEEQKRVNESVIKAQKEKDQNLIKDQRKRDLDMLKDQIRRDREMMDKVRGDSAKARDEVLEKSKEETDNIKKGGKQDVDKIKKTAPGKSQDSTRSELDRLKKLPQ